MLKIRNSQMQVFDEILTTCFIGRVLSYWKSIAPSMFDQDSDIYISDNEAKLMISSGLKRARSYHIISEIDVVNYLDFVLTIHSKFELMEDYSWALPILKNRAYPAKCRIDLVADRLKYELNRVQGLASCE